MKNIERKDLTEVFLNSKKKVSKETLTKRKKPATEIISCILSWFHLPTRAELKKLKNFSTPWENISQQLFVKALRVFCCCYYYANAQHKNNMASEETILWEEGKNQKAYTKSECDVFMSTRVGKRAKHFYVVLQINFNQHFSSRIVK